MSNDNNAADRADRPASLSLSKDSGVVDVGVPNDWNGIIQITARRPTSTYIVENVMGITISMSFELAGDEPDLRWFPAPYALPSFNPQSPSSASARSGAPLSLADRRRQREERERQDD